ncbi:MAG: cellulase family glycosylhydrolase [Gaiellaceae bacterium]
MRVLGLGLGLVSVVLLFAGQATAASSVRFGIQDDAWLQHGPGTLSARVAALDRLGLDVVRVTVNWHEVEQSPGSFTWRRTDALLNSLNSRGLDPVVTLWGTPGWANGDQPPNRAPDSATDFANFARTVAARYRFVDHWVIWNEPNQRRWLDPVSPAQYVSQLLNPAYHAIKSVTPSAKVAGGVTAPRGNRGGMSPVSFLRLMDRAGAVLDAYAHHPYPSNPSDTPFYGACSGCKTITMSSLERLVREVDRAFPRARIWLTEYGYQTTPDPFGLTLDLQARYVAEAARRVHAVPKVDMLIHYLYRDEPDLARWQSGLETVEGRAKPALSAMMLPLVQVSRRGSTTRLWGQVRPGSGRQRYALQQLVGGRWVTQGGYRTTSAGGYLARRISARRGAKLRLWYPSARAASLVLVVR